MCQCYNCGNSNLYYKIRYALVFYKVELKNKYVGEKISIKDILDNLNQNCICNCGNQYKLIRNFTKCPNYLIIIIADMNIINNYKFFIEEEIYVNNYCSDNSNNNIKYELIYFIHNNCCSYLKKDKWIQYNDEKVRFDFDINNYDFNFPYFLIYKKKFI